MGESLKQRRRERDEGLRFVNLFQQGKNLCVLISVYLTVPAKEAPANSVPGDAVIRRVRPINGIKGGKALVGVFPRQG